MLRRNVHRYRRPVTLLALLVLLALTGYLYSPWHRHDSRSASTCPFSGFEHSVPDQPDAALLLPPRLAGFQAPFEMAATARLILCREISSPRAPPVGTVL